jgi:hypothetical protein
MDSKLAALCIAASAALSAVATGMATSKDFDAMATLVDTERADRKAKLAATYEDSRPDDFKCSWLSLPDGTFKLAILNNGTYSEAWQKEMGKTLEPCPDEKTRPVTPESAPPDEPKPEGEIDLSKVVPPTTPAGEAEKP